MNDIDTATERPSGVTTIEYVSDTAARIERVFDAPVERVWELWNDPARKAEWLGPRSQRLTLSEWDVREGGEYRFSSVGPDGVEHRFSGTYSVVEPPHVLEGTFNYLNVEAPPSIDHMELIELPDGRTLMVTTSTFPSKDVLDRFLASGMEGGMNEGYERFEALL